MAFPIIALYDTNEFTYIMTTKHVGRLNKASQTMTFVAVPAELLSAPRSKEADENGSSTPTSVKILTGSSTLSVDQVPVVGAGDGSVLVGGGFGESVVVGVDRRVMFLSNDGTTISVHDAEFERRISALAYGSSVDDLVVGLRHGGLHAASPGSVDYGHLAVVTALDRTDSYVVSGDRDGLLRIAHASAIYDVAAFALGHTHWVSAVTTLPGRRFVSAAGDGTIRLWDLDRLPTAIATLTFSADSAVKSYVSSLIYRPGTSTLVAVVVNVTEDSSRLMQVHYDAAAGTLTCAGDDDAAALAATPVAHPLCVAPMAGSDTAFLVGGRNGQLAASGEGSVSATVVAALAGEGREHDVAWLFRSDREREGTVAAGDEDLLSAEGAAAKRAKMQQ